MRAGKDQPVFFKSKWLEKLSQTPPWLPVLFWLPICCYLFYRSYNSLELERFLVIIFIGIAFWSLSEYLLHRFIFHFKAKKPIGKMIVFFIHENHHVYPNDRLRGLFPVLPAFLIASVFFQMFNLMTTLNTSMGLMGGFIVGYLIYDYLHFSFHHFHFEFKWWRKLKARHLYHHVHDHCDFGVSSSFWDFIFKSKEFQK